MVAVSVLWPQAKFKTPVGRVEPLPAWIQPESKFAHCAEPWLLEPFYVAPRDIYTLSPASFPVRGTVQPHHYKNSVRQLHRNLSSIYLLITCYEQDKVPPL